MIALIHFLLTVAVSEDHLETFNRQIAHHLNSVADSDYFSKIKMAFNDKCPISTKKCELSTCDTPRIQFEGKDGYIDLSSVVESYSPVSSKGGSVVWGEVYNLVKDNKTLQKIVSGLHFSVTTHLASKHTKIFSFYFSNPLIFKKRFNREYRENYMHLYNIIRAAVAKLGQTEGEIPESAKTLGNFARRLMVKEFEIRKEKSPYVESGSHNKSLLDYKKTKDIENVVDTGILEQSSTDEFMSTVPFVGKENLDILNEMVKCVSCLECQKCKLWGTIQVKGIKSAVKLLNGMALSKNEVIYLVNLFRQLSLTMSESKRLESIRMPVLYLPIVCHRQVLMLIVTTLSLLFLTLKLRRMKRRK